jgi:lipopolysaccharide transport system ATP-binding protein
MAIAFKKVTLPPLQSFTANAPDRAIIGLVGDEDSGKSSLLRIAVGTQKPISGSVSAGKNRRLVGPDDALNFAPVDLLALDHTFSRHDATIKSRSLMALDRLRRSGATILVVSNDDDLLTRLCDELWWIQEGRLASRGDAQTVLTAYRSNVADRLRQWGETISNPPMSLTRTGDGRAEIVSLETVGTHGRPTAIWRSGEQVQIRLAVRFKEDVPDPVIGILIRNRIGLDVYGTNTELEGLRFGPCGAGQTVKLSFAFHCDLCPHDYTVTAASHDPDGTKHDWLEDAVAITVVDDRYTAGVANLRARVTLG